MSHLLFSRHVAAKLPHTPRRDETSDYEAPMTRRIVRRYFGQTPKNVRRTESPAQKLAARQADGHL